MSSMLSRRLGLFCWIAISLIMLNSCETIYASHECISPKITATSSPGLLRDEASVERSIICTNSVSAGKQPAVNMLNTIIE